MTPFKTTLGLDHLETRETPAVFDVTKITPVPIPPSVVGTPVVKVLTVDTGDKAGILFPVFKPVQVNPPVAPNAILFPVFVGR